MYKQSSLSIFSDNYNSFYVDFFVQQDMEFTLEIKDYYKPFVSKKDPSITYYHQEKGNTCWPCSLRMLLSWLGIYRDESELEELCKTQSCWSETYVLQQVCMLLWLQTIMWSWITLDILESYYQQWYKIMVWVWHHYVVYVWQDNENVFLCDPLLWSDIERQKIDFENSWDFWDNSDWFHWFLAIK